MPFVRISLLRGRQPTELRAIADGIHEALVATFNVPADDRFQVIDQHEPGEMVIAPEYLGIRHTDRFVVVHIVASRGRDAPTKQRLYEAIAGKLARVPNLTPQDVMVILSPNEREDWSFGSGVGQYINAAA